MPQSDLPDRASLEYLKKLAKDRLREMREDDARARLSTAQLEVAREHGFSSWRALKAELDRRTSEAAGAFLAACRAGDVRAVRAHLARYPWLISARHDGTTGLHAAAAHPDLLRLLLEHGADPNVRDQGDNALPLHFAAGHGPLEAVRILLDAGSDVQGEGDVHRLDTIGWATVFAEARRDVVGLLVQRGARHHVFSAIAMGEPDLVRRVVHDDPGALDRRLSPTEQEQTALHYVIAPPDGLVGGLFRTGEHYETLRALIELGADLEARDAKGRTPLAVAMLRGDKQAMRLLHEAGAAPPDEAEPTRTVVPLSSFARSIGKICPMFSVTDMGATIAWYEAVGFALTASHGEGDVLDWAQMTFGEAELMLVPSGPGAPPSRRGLSLWINTDRLDELYAALKRHQMERASAELAGEQLIGPEVAITSDLYTAFYGQREFGLEDPNGVEVMFAQRLDARPSGEGRRE